MKQFILAINCLLYLSGTAQVTLYQEKNFSGTAKTLALGQYSLSDFNDMVNSVRVAPGNVIVLYEDAENNKGTGKSIDILEDCPDLNVYNFDKKASFVVVFAAANGNRIWVRNRLENGQFIPGHWEHKRANGSSPNSTVAVVAPAYQPVTPPVVTIDPGTPPPSINPPPGNGTRIRISGDKYVINSLATLSADELATWDHAVTDQNGVLGSDFNGKQIIGSAAFQRKFENGAIGTGANALGASNLNFWYPQKEKGDNSAYPYYKRTLTGNLQWTDIYDNVKSLPDHDLNIDIVPAAGYEYLITKAHPSEKSKLTTAAFTKDGHPLKDCPASYSQIECEIDLNDAAKAILLNLLRSLYGSKVCVYGAWIFDNGHCCQPEIHPAEQIWWTRPAPGGKIYYFNLIADDSKRYWWRDQMDDGTKLRPWGAPPVTGTFAIAFETEVNTNRPVEMQIFNVANIHDRHVKAYPNTDHNYDLEYNGQTLIRFIPHNDAFYVRYSNVGLVPGTNKLRGFLVIQSTVGKATQIATKAYWLGKYIGTYPMGSDPDKVPQQAERSLFKKEEGHYLFTVTHTVQKPVVIQ